MNINPSEVRSVLQKLELLYMEDRNRKGCCNYTNPYIQEQEEIAASLFILIIVGFFGFLLFAMMISNIVSKQRLNYTDYLYQEKFQGNRKRLSSKDVLTAVNNNITSEVCNSSQCQKANSCVLATETPNTDSTVINV